MPVGRLYERNEKRWQVYFMSSCKCKAHLPPSARRHFPSLPTSPLLFPLRRKLVRTRTATAVLFERRARALRSFVIYRKSRSARAFNCEQRGQFIPRWHKKGGEVERGEVVLSILRAINKIVFRRNRKSKGRGESSGLPSVFAFASARAEEPSGNLP